MINRILVATDGSDNALRAVDMAAEIAKSFNASLTILHVLLHGGRTEEASNLAQAEHLVRHVTKTAMPDLQNIPGSMTDLFRSSRSNEETAQLITALGDLIAGNAVSRAQTLGVENLKTSVTMGDYAEAILEAADSNDADMIVVGSRGLGGLKGLLLGSVSNKVSLHAKCSVLTVK